MAHLATALLPCLLLLLLLLSLPEPSAAAAVRPPVEVNVTSALDSLILTFQHPFKDSDSHSNFNYCVSYWEESTTKHKEECTRNTYVKLQNLKQLTVYCFQIQTTFKSNTGPLSNMQCHRTAANGSQPQLPAPQNVTIYSYNLQNSLRWDPVKVHSGSVQYIVQYNALGGPGWLEINCTNITKTECNFTHPDIKNHWTVVLRVRAQLGQMKSDWVETNKFEADKNTTVGPPVEVNVTSAPDSLILTFQHPFKDSDSLSSFNYCVSYWEESTTKHKKECTNTIYIKLENLKQLTVYCFQIQTIFKGNAGPLRGSQCHRTAASDAARAGFVLLLFFGILLVVVILAFVCSLFIQRFHKAVKYWSQPPFKLPLHIEEYLEDSEMPALDEWCSNHAEDDHWDSLSVVSSAEASQALVRNSLHTNVHSDD